MKLNKSIVALTSLVAFAATPLFAGTGKTFKETVVVEEEESSWYNAAVSTGWDSLYMFRGYNTIRPDGNAYGSGIYWTDVSFTWNITDNDFLTVGSWVGFGTQNTSYKEFDARATYTHTFGDLAASLGYTSMMSGVQETLYMQMSSMLHSHTQLTLVDSPSLRQRPISSIWVLIWKIVLLTQVLWPQLQASWSSD